jgi:hypothetical protein
MGGVGHEVISHFVGGTEENQEETQAIHSLDRD